MKPLLSIGLLVLLTACVSVPLSSMWKLRNFDPLAADPSKIRLAVITDKIVDLKDNSTSLSLGFSAKLQAHTFTDTFFAKIRRDATVPELEKFKGNDQRVTLFYLDNEAANRMRIAQNRIRVVKQQQIDGDGSLSVAVNTGCFNGPKPSRLLANIYVRFSDEQGYIKLVSEIDLLTEAENIGQTFWFECE